MKLRRWTGWGALIITAAAIIYGVSVYRRHAFGLATDLVPRVNNGDKNEVIDPTTIPPAPKVDFSSPPAWSRNPFGDGDHATPSAIAIQGNDTVVPGTTGR